MFSASLGQGSRLPRWLCGVRPVSRPLWASVPKLLRGLGSRWLLGVVQGCARCPRGCPGPATRPLHASSFSSLPWTSSSARDAADEKRVSKAVAPLGGRLPGARAAHRDPSLHLLLGRGALPGAGPAPQRAPAPPAPHRGLRWRRRRSRERPTVLAGSCCPPGGQRTSMSQTR